MRSKWRKFACFAVALFLAVGLFSIDINAADKNGSFWIEFIDVGQGDSALIQCDGHYLMIDGGPADASSTIYTILQNKGIKKIDYMIATHSDADHIGGLSGALNYAKVGKCYSLITSHDTKTFKNLLKYLGKQDIALTVPSADEKFKLGSALVELIGPIYSSEEANNNSIIVKITYGENSFIFMGDAEEEEEASLLSSEKDLSSDVIKIGHHGSSNSTSDALLREVNPVFAVISVGKNSYGHPTKKILKKLEKSYITVYRTDLQGDIICSSDGTNISFSTEK